jgi:hypothetical protein
VSADDLVTNNDGAFAALHIPGAENALLRIAEVTMMEIQGGNVVN